MNSKISVVVPVYNVEKYLAKCLDSLVNQTFKELEIILVNDGSSDKSGSICEMYAEKDERIKIINVNHQGLSMTRNAGVKACTADMVAFVDSDDYVSLDYFEVLYKNMVEHDADVAMTGYSVVKENGEIILDSSSDNNFKANEVIVYEKKDIMKELLLQKTIKNFSWKLYRKKVLCDFPKGVNYEDFVFSTNVMSKAKRVVYINSGSYKYLKRSGSISATLSESNLLDFGTAIKNRYLFVKEHFPKLEVYNYYACFESLIALSTKYIITDIQYDKVDQDISNLINIITTYVTDKKQGQKLITMFNDYELSCLYLMKYNKTLYYYFLKKRHELKVLGEI